MTSIEWTDETWNPVTGCSKVSPGCKHCYAETIAHRFWGERPFTEVRCHPERLEIPLHWKKPRRIFVNSMSDLFHEDVPASFITQVFEVMEASPQHTFQILTKRPERIESVLYGDEGQFYLGGGDWVRNVLIGFSAEDQRTFDARSAVFLPRNGERCSWAYALRLFVSLEPLLGPVQIRHELQPLIQTASDGQKFYRLGRNAGHPGLQWVIVGGESGPTSRPCDVAWIESIVRQCQAAGIPVFVKQLGRLVLDGPIGRSGHVTAQSAWKPRDGKGGDPSEWPEDLRAREWPR